MSSAHLELRRRSLLLRLLVFFFQNWLCGECACQLDLHRRAMDTNVEKRLARAHLTATPRVREPCCVGRFNSRGRVELWHSRRVLGGFHQLACGGACDGGGLLSSASPLEAPAKFCPRVHPSSIFWRALSDSAGPCDQSVDAAPCIS